MSDLVINNNSNTIFGVLRSTTSLNDAQICGFLANMKYETGNFNPTAVGDNGKAYGLCQWRDSRRQRLERYSNYSKIEPQLAFLWWELTTDESGTERAAFREIVKAPRNRDGAYAAGYAVSKYYERPLSVEWEANRRGELAKGYWDYYIEGKAVDAIIIADPSTHSPTPGDSSGTYTGTRVSSNIPDYLSLASVDPYADSIKENLSKVEAAGYDYGYLIDMTNGDEFKFYIPEFSESAGANWSNIDIPGRSVSIKSYSSTNSRTISISLDLYAGVGLYTSGDDVVGKLHSDANFVKSLEYPDYSISITRPPATVHLILGSVVSIAGVVSDVTVEHLKPRDSQNRSMYIKLSFTVTQTAFDPPGFRDIRDGNYTIPNTSNPGSISEPASNTTNRNNRVNKTY